MTCAACLSSAAGCAAHRDPLDTMGARVGALVARGWLVDLAPRGDEVRVTLVRRGCTPEVHYGANAAHALARAWEAACLVDPALVGIGMAVGA